MVNCSSGVYVLFLVEGGGDFSLFGGRVSTAGAGGRFSLEGRLSEGDFGGGWRRRGVGSIWGSSGMMTDVGDVIVPRVVGGTVIGVM